LPEPAEAAALEWVAAPGPPLADGGLRAVELRGLRLLLCRAGGALYALADRCPHAGAALSRGVLRGCTLYCPLHGGALDVRDGRPATPPIRRPVVTYPVRVRGDAIEIAIPPAA
jgi:3-phenylpropionate/trans-cinnamate dioxygenase ferredoxin subunit